MTAQPYADAAELYASAGWAPLPLGDRPGLKTPPPTGYTGQEGRNPTPDDIATWINSRGARNIGVRLPEGVVGIDVDDYGDKAGADTMKATAGRHGRLPKTWVSTSRAGLSGIRWFRAPIGIMPGKLVHPDDEDRSGVEVIQHTHRYAVVPPSIHPEGRPYQWISPDGEYVDTIPTPSDLPELPPAWVDHIRKECSCYVATTYDWNRYLPTDTKKSPVWDTFDRWSGRLNDSYGRHDAATGGTMALVGFRHKGWPEAQDALDRLEQQFYTALGDSRSRREAEAEWKRMVEGAEAKAPSTSIPEYRAPLATVSALPTKTAPTDDWTPVDLGPVLDGDASHLDPPPTILERTDGIFLLYRGELNWLNGEPEAGKSWLAQLALAQEIKKGNEVMYLDLEDTPSRVVDRLILLGVKPEAIRRYLRYVRPTTASTDIDVERLLSYASTTNLTVIDGTTDLHAIHGWSIEDNMDSAKMISHLLRPLADCGPAVWPLDHVTKNKDNRGRYAIGAQHKLAAVRGASYGLEVIDPMGRGVKGHSRLFVHKDRPGHVRGINTLRIGSKHSAGDFWVDAREPAIKAWVESPTESAFAKERAQLDEVYRFVVEHYTDKGRGPSQRTVESNVTGKGTAVRDCLKTLTDSGRLFMTKTGNGLEFIPSNMVSTTIETEES